MKSNCTEERDKTTIFNHIMFWVLPPHLETIRENQEQRTTGFNWGENKKQQQQPQPFLSDATHQA